jgi:ATP-dependent HslUV protease ATP-binding subunit HslU
MSAILKTKKKFLILPNLQPKDIVAKLDQYVIGQQDAKRAVAISLRNRYRRMAITDESLRKEIMPKNVLLVGPTGVGKTEIVKRLAEMQDAPFLKVEATKFTEIGYVGRDVESIIRDLADKAFQIIRNKYKVTMSDGAKTIAEKIVLEAIIGKGASKETYDSFLKKLRSGDLDDTEIEIEVNDSNSNGGGFNFDMPGNGAVVGMMPLGDIFSKITGGDKKTKVVSVKEAMEILIEDESSKGLDENKIGLETVNWVENDGIVFIDEIDKIISTANSGSRGEVSREGVQRDLLPLLEGTVVQTKYGSIRTDHILFIASGAFYTVKVGDLLPELQGRLPIRVSLKALTEEDFFKILTVPIYNITRQYSELLAVDNLDINFQDSGLKEMAKIAVELNSAFENTGARRLHTIIEKTVEEISFGTTNDSKKIKIIIDNIFVRKQCQILFDNIGNNPKMFIL